ncbi:MAG: hypothetical protein WBH47_05635 [Streptosporangiaceae bacterium]
MHVPRRPPASAGLAAAQGSDSAAGRNRLVALTVAGTAALLVLTGCAKMDAALDQQWMVVDLNPGTSVATALHIRAACSHIQNTPPMALPAQRTEIAILYGVRYDTTNASPANLAELQTCLQRFPSVQGVEPEDAGDEGD